MATTRVTLAKADEIREFLRGLREKNPDLKASDGRDRANRKFGVELGPTSFKKTFWDRSEPEEAGAEEEPSSLVWIEPAEDGQARLCVDVTDDRERVFAAAAAVSTVFATRGDTSIRGEEDA